MSFRDCVLGTIGRSHVRRQAAEAMLEQYEARVTELQSLGDTVVQAEVKAAEEFATVAAEEAKWAKVRRVRDAQVQIRQSNRIMNASTRPGKELARIFGDVERVANGYLGVLHSQLTDFMNQYNTRVLGGFRSKADLDNVLKELYGQDSGHAPSKAFADAIRNMHEEVTKMARANGVHMQNDPNYHAPQGHDKHKMTSAGVDQWVKSHMGEGILDWDQMKHFNGGKIIPAGEREDVLRKVYATLVSDGANKITFDYRHDVSTSARLTQKRFLRYASPEAWTQMQEAYGVGSLADQIIEYMSATARDLGQIQVLGPNPAMAKRRLESAVEQRVDQLMQETRVRKDIGQKKIKKLENKEFTPKASDIKHADVIYGYVTGRNSNIEDNTSAAVAATARLGLTGALLGKAILSAVPGDLAMMKHVALFSGHKQMSPVKQYMKLLNPASARDRNIAKTSGLVMETAMANLKSAERFGGDPLGPKWARHMADGALRATGLSHHTEIARWAFGMELMADFARHSNVKFDDLPFRETMERRGLTASDWDIFRATPVADLGDGALFLRPKDLLTRKDIDASVANDVFGKITRYQNDLQEMAVPTASVEAKAHLIGDTTGGTAPGELTRAFAMFKNFPVTIMMKHWGEGLKQASLGGKVKYLMSFMAFMTGAGAVSEQFHALSRGQDLRDMTQPIFWADAMARGGGLGLFTDLLFEDQGRYGGGFFSKILGPNADFAQSVTSNTYRTIQQLASGEDVKALETVKLARKVVPGSHIWYLDLAINALFGELVLEELDPQFHRKQRRKERKTREESGATWWWRGDQPTPDRAPSAENILGQ